MMTVPQIQVQELLASSHVDETHVFEVHVTVRLNSDQTIEQFRRACNEIRVSPVVLELQARDGTLVMHDVMTSSTVRMTNAHVLEYVQTIGAQLKERGFNVLRHKVEATWWHPLARKDEDVTPTTDRYFETHIRVRHSDASGIDRLCNYIKESVPDVHVSRNVFKADNKGVINMLTYRAAVSYPAFKRRLDQITGLLSDKFSLGKIEIEYAVYDTHVKHDAQWLTTTI